MSYSKTGKTSPSTKTPTDNIIAKFPLKGREPRRSQALYIQAVHNAFQDGARFVILEAPVGSGKSASAMTWALQYGNSHVLTPRKALQDQYFEDFKDFAVMMKGKSAYPCTKYDPRVNTEVYDEIERGMTPSPATYSSGISVQEGWCGGKKGRYERCTKANGACPYAYAATYANGKPHVVHNIYGFLFQASLAEKFTPRQLLVIDEAHDLDKCLRDYYSIEFKLPKTVLEVPELQTVGEYIDFFSKPEFIPRIQDDEDTYREQLVKLASFEDAQDLFVLDVRREELRTIARLIPRRFSHMVEKSLWRFGEKIVCMSGTIYDKQAFCRTLGIPPEEAVFIRVESDFPVNYRPIIMKPEYMVDTSHAAWEENFPRLIEVLETILTKIPNDKGLIHTPSYRASEEIAAALRARGHLRVVAHTSENTADALQAFYASAEPLVFLSPSCQQGVDFKDDRARFQVVIRVPYLNAGDKFVGTIMKEDFAWYNLQALRIFGQQLGRINRHEKDFGVTILIDSRFNRFIQANKRYLPKDVLASIQR